MRKGGRPLQLIGVRSKDLRIRFHSPKGRTRGFYARWRPGAQCWECQLSGFSMQPRRWFSDSQSLALAELRHVQCLWNWRRVVVDQAVQWDGVFDAGLYAGRVVEHCELSGPVAV